MINQQNNLAACHNEVSHDISDSEYATAQIGYKSTARGGEYLITPTFKKIMLQGVDSTYRTMPSGSSSYPLLDAPGGENSRDFRLGLEQRDGIRIL